MELRKTFQSIIALHQQEFPFDLRERTTKLPIGSNRIVTVTGIRRCGKSSQLGLVINAEQWHSTRTNLVYRI